MIITEIIQHFKNVKQVSGNQYSLDCPACGKKEHLYLSETDGKILLDCKKGCTFKEIVQASGLKAKDFFPDNQPKSTAWTKLREHIYTNENGEVQAKKVIYDKGCGDKTASWYRFENGGYIKKLNGLKVLP